jgi:hypothetical protein
LLHLSHLQVVSPDLSNTLCVWRNMWNDSDHLARQAKVFIDSQWAAARIAAVQAERSTPSA